MLVMWLLVRRPLGARVRFQATRARQAATPLRRSWYLLGLAWRPPAAKEMRVFGLGEWIADRHREEWLEGMTPTWQELRRLSKQVWVAGGLVLAAYALAAGTIGWAADHDEITLRTLATMLMMLPASMAVGSITLADISLAQMLASLPDLDALTSSLRAGAEVADVGEEPLPAAGLPRRNVRFERVTFTYPGARGARAARPRPRAAVWGVARVGGRQRGGQDDARDPARAHAGADRWRRHGRRRAADPVG